jgi:hypothetical protein
MQYMCLIYTDEKAEPLPGTDEFSEYIGGYFAFSEEMKAKRVMVDGNALQSVSTATTITVRKGKTKTTDGPFAETKEQLGGYYILDCKDLDEAISYAAKIPGAGLGKVEIRPVMVFEN